MLIRVLKSFLLASRAVINRIRLAALLARFKAVGTSCHVGWPLEIYGAHHITLGQGVSIGDSCQILACDTVNIGENVLIADPKYLASNQSQCSDASCLILDSKLVVSGKIQIGNYSWIGENVRIYGNVTIGKHCIVSANSVLTKDLPDYSVAIGAPACIVRRYDFETQQWRKTDQDGLFIEEVFAKERITKTFCLKRYSQRAG